MKHRVRGFKQPKAETEADHKLVNKQIYRSAYMYIYKGMHTRLWVCCILQQFGVQLPPKLETGCKEIVQELTLADTTPHTHLLSVTPSFPM